MKPVIRKATKRDSKAFLELLVGLANFEHLAPPDAGARRRITRDVFVNKKINLLLARVGESVVGYALYFYTYSSFLARPTLYLEDIFVLDEFRRRGVGKMLFLACVDEAVRLRCGRMEWAVLTWNEKAISFYEELGAKRLDEWYVYRLPSDVLGRLSSAADLHSQPD